MNTVKLFNRSGSEWTGKVLTSDKGKPYVSYMGPCNRCGGQGGSEAWKFTGYTCYRCNGERSMHFEHVTFPLYTQEELAKLNTRLEAARERKAAREAAEAAAAVETFLANASDELKAAYSWAMDCPEADPTAQDIAAKAGRGLSDKQTGYLVKLFNRATETARRATVQAAENAAAEDCPNGKTVITGTVLSTKWVDGPKIYGVTRGGTLKMLVRDERGFKVYGSVPSSIDVQKGDTVRFTATVERSGDDPKFGFYSRPSKGEVVATAESNGTETAAPV